MGLRDLLRGKRNPDEWDVEREETVSSPHGETTTTYYTPRQGAMPQTRTVTRTREWREEIPRPTSMGFRIAEAKHQKGQASQKSTPRKSSVGIFNQQMAKFDAGLAKILGPPTKGVRFHYAPKSRSYKPPNIGTSMNKLGAEMNRNIFGTRHTKKRR